MYGLLNTYLENAIKYNDMQYVTFIMCVFLYLNAVVL